MNTGTVMFWSLVGLILALVVLYNWKHQYNMRTKACNSCEHRVANKCGICGCWLVPKKLIPMTECPDNKWEC